MKTQTRLISFMTLLLSMAGCNEDGFYEKDFLVALGKAPRNNYCAIDDTKTSDPIGLCEAASGCQALLTSDLKFFACIPILEPTGDTDTTVTDTTSGDVSNDGGSNTGDNTGDTGGDTGSNTGDTGGDTGSNTGDTGGDTSSNTGDTGGDTSSNTGDTGNGEELEDEENPGQEYVYLCGDQNHKVLVCHLPSGNQDKARTLCIARQGWENGHSKHTGDHLGACNSNDFK